MRTQQAGLESFDCRKQPQAARVEVAVYSNVTDVRRDGNSGMGRRAGFELKSFKQAAAHANQSGAFFDRDDEIAAHAHR